VASDTICFPAKLVHGHVLDLSKQGVDRIFLPYILHMPTENKGEKSPYVCPVIMGYSMVVRNFPARHALAQSRSVLAGRSKMREARW